MGIGTIRSDRGVADNGLVPGGHRTGSIGRAPGRKGICRVGVVDRQFRKDLRPRALVVLVFAHEGIEFVLAADPSVATPLGIRKEGSPTGLLVQGGGTPVNTAILRRVRVHRAEEGIVVGGDIGTPVDKDGQPLDRGVLAAGRLGLQEFVLDHDIAVNGHGPGAVVHVHIGLVATRCCVARLFRNTVPKENVEANLRAAFHWTGSDLNQI
mmetsp:Transcript_18537/g.37968  ORF Transcript_18537/g.37968 Transcript_18537/m.37968 type:complete len:210 (-) Transcript_18537:874-1503(-)